MNNILLTKNSTARLLIHSKFMSIVLLVTLSQPIEVVNAEDGHDQFLLNIYQNYMGPAKADTCTSFPSCSHYAKDAFKNNTFFKSIVFTVDRLNRCGNDTHFYPNIIARNKVLNFDPPPNSDYTLTETYNEPHYFIKNIDVNLFDPPKGVGLEIKLFDFANYLFITGEYKTSLIEYKRYKRYYSDSNRIPEIDAKIFYIYYITNDYENAIQKGVKFIKNYPGDKRINEIKYWLAASYIKVHNHSMAKKIINTLIEIDYTFDESISMLAYIQASEYEYEKALKTYINNEKTFSSNNQINYVLRPPKTKNPTVAGALAVVPGLGYLYADHKKSAMSAFIINALLMGAAYESFENDNNVLGALISTVGLGWYAGNIYGSVSAAKRYNQNKHEDFVLKFQVGFRF